LLRHCTEVDVESNYVDTQGVSVVGFAFTELPGFRLLPRLKNIGAIRLYRPDGAEANGELSSVADLDDPLGPDHPAVRPDGKKVSVIG